MERRRSHLLLFARLDGRIFSELVSLFIALNLCNRWVQLKIFQYNSSHLLRFLSANLSYESVENFINIASQRSWGLIEWTTTKLHGESFSFFEGNFTLWLKIEFVGNQNQWNVFGESHSSDEFSILACFLEAVTVTDGIANDETFSTSHILISHGSELNLASSIEDV